MQNHRFCCHPRRHLCCRLRHGGIKVDAAHSMLPQRKSNQGWVCGKKNGECTWEHVLILVDFGSNFSF
ncbi:hypothetical protein JHK84_037001 [Glycine max]|nr:hypothetical protein JHK84_037001 [Glycine max]